MFSTAKLDKYKKVILRLFTVKLLKLNWRLTCERTEKHNTLNTGMIIQLLADVSSNVNEARKKEAVDPEFSSENILQESRQS